MAKSLVTVAICLMLAGLTCLAGADEHLPAFYGPLSLPAQPLASVAEVYADFGTLLSRLGATGALDLASVRVVGPTGQVLPTSFTPDAQATDRGVVRWSVPAMPDAAGPVEFRIYFEARSSRSWQVAPAVDAPGANLLPNGGMERVDRATSKPVGWNCSPASMAVTDPALAHSGQSCLKMSPALADEKTGRWQNGQTTPGSPGVIVEPNRSYSFRYWARAEGCKPTTYNLVCAAQVYWYRADKSYIRHDGCRAALRADAPWTEMADAIQSPPDARYAMVALSFYSSVGALYVDDFAIAAAQRPQLGVARSADGTRQASLRVSDPNVRRYDFGKDDSATWPQFTAVTPESGYSKEAGYGWLGAAKAYASVRPLPDDLARDNVVPSAGCQFRVDLPEGDYRAWLLIGDTGLGGTIIPTFVDWRVGLNGQEVLRYRPDAKTWYNEVMFAHMDEWWEPGVDVYDRFVAPTFQEKTIPCTVQGGQLRLELQGMPLCALVVYPATAEQAMEQELAQLRAARKRSVPVRFDEPPHETAQGVTAADRKRGYVTFARDMAKTVYPGSAPQEGEAITGLSTFAAPGQFENLTFSIYPLAKVGSVSVTASDLVGPGTSRIKGADLQIGVLRYMESSLSGVEYRYTVRPGPIQPRNPMPVPDGVTMSWCVRLQVPLSAAPGVYKGKLHIAPTGADASDLDLTLRVVPIKLEPTPITAGLYHFDHSYWYIYWWRQCFKDADGWLREQTFQHEADDFALLKDYNINSLAPCDDLRSQATVTADGDIKIAPGHRFIQWMDLYTKAGLGPVPWYGFSAISCSYLSSGIYGQKLEPFSPQWEKAYRSIITWVKQNEQKRGWPEVLMYLSDELSNEGAKGAEVGRQLVQLTKDIPGIRTISSMNGRWERIMLPGLTIAMPNHAFPITEETVKEVRDAGCELWFYNIGNGRVVWGLYPWRMGAKGRFQWFHRYDITQPWNTFDGDSGYCCTRLTPGKPLPTMDLVHTARGLDDLRYVTALEKAIAAAKQSRKPGAVKAAEAAQKDLDELRALLPDNVKLLIGEMDPKEAGKPAIGNFANDRYLDRQRWLIASHIIAVQQAMGE